MKGDFTRFTFKPEQHYNGVRMQQGRVQLDTDFNEYVDIQAYLSHTATKDVIGPCGAPQADGGFEIGVSNDGNDLTISPGRFYVDGILCQAEDAVTYSSQPDYPNPVPALDGDEPIATGTYLAYLDVWHRLITVLEDSSVREVALGGPDTTTRTKTISQVKILRVGEARDESLNCLSEFEAWQLVTAPSSGRMSARAEPEETATNPCIVPASAGYRGLENQLYRVEIHAVTYDEEAPDTVTSITIKWSRENGSITTAWEELDILDPDQPKLTVSNTGRDEVLGFAPDNWIELTDDERELKGESGILVKIQQVNGTDLTIDPGTETVNFNDFAQNPKVRRWDMPGDTTGAILVDLSTLEESWIELENGIEVRFESGTYRPGDYWVIPARTATGDIEWPRDEGTEDSLPQPPHGIAHHYCHLALLNFDEEGWSVVDDCRPLFPPLTELTRFFYVGGDGQEAMPGNPLPQLLQVGVMNGMQPVGGRTVRFTALDTDGRVAATHDDLETSTTNTIDVETDTAGIASCAWLLNDAGSPSQQLTAALLDAADNPSGSIPITFTANLSLAREVAYEPGACEELAEAETVQQALDILCNLERSGCCVTVGNGGRFERLDEAITTLLEEGQRDICICLLPGDHLISGLELVVSAEEPELRLKIAGCGQGSRVFLEGPLRFRGIYAIVLDDVAFQLRFAAEGEQGAMAFDRCREVTITSCYIAGVTALLDQSEPGGVLVSITNADRVTLRDNVLEAALPESLEPTRAVFDQAGAALLAELFSLPLQGEFEAQRFRLRALETAQQLFQLSLDVRQQIRENITTALSDLGQEFNQAELFSFSILLAELSFEELALEDLYDTLLDIRRTAIKSRPGVAVILGADFNPASIEDFEFITIDQDDYATLENNDLIGILSLYGMPPSIDFIRGVLNSDVLAQLEERLSGGTISLRSRGLLGTLQLRGNQFVRLTVARRLVEQLQQMSQGNAGAFGLFNRCFIHDNVIEGDNNLVFCVHQTMNGNDFAMRTFRTQDGRVEIGLVVADSAIYVGNHSGDPDWVLRDISRTNSIVGNLEMTIA